ncbi:hypothetical protein FB45DRAFT_1044416 [Roridomyces roridus]|uniref:Uncharacterized protein n=1 Tax=Roridomyces roridus TaxID=1738132 RepID=A0AAD7F603_9AGAR|nr:hypothetical protein FB45DRAFT_1044416 [Roridomyces roridus]
MSVVLSCKHLPATPITAVGVSPTAVAVGMVPQYNYWPCSVCNPCMAYVPWGYWATPPPRTSGSMACLNPSNSAYPLYATGPPVSAWSSPGTTVMDYPNARVRVDWRPRPAWGWGLYYW